MPPSGEFNPNPRHESTEQKRSPLEVFTEVLGKIKRRLEKGESESFIAELDSVRELELYLLQHDAELGDDVVPADNGVKKEFYDLKDEQIRRVAFRLEFIRNSFERSAQLSDQVLREFIRDVIKISYEFGESIDFVGKTASLDLDKNPEIYRNLAAIKDKINAYFKAHQRTGVNFDVSFGIHWYCGVFRKLQGEVIDLYTDHNLTMPNLVGIMRNIEHKLDILREFYYPRDAERIRLAFSVGAQEFWQQFESLTKKLEFEKGEPDKRLASKTKKMLISAATNFIDFHKNSDLSEEDPVSITVNNNLEAWLKMNE